MPTRRAAADPWLSDRLRADIALSAAEKQIEAAATAAITAWLAAARWLVLGRRADHDSRAQIIAAQTKATVPAAVTAAALRAAADPEFSVDLSQIQASFGVWQAGLQDHLEPAISDAFGKGFGGATRSALISPLPYQEKHIAEVHDRLKIWPQGAWEDMRPELQQIISRSGTIEDAANQVASILDINAPTRRLRQQIAEVDAKLDGTADAGNATIRELRAQRRQLWQEHDKSLGQWQHLARRIARTEVHGAIEGGQQAAAEATQNATGEPLFKQWLASHDARVRRSHAIADGQIVPVTERFQVGRARLKHPGEPGGPAHEVIHCRCTTKVLDQSEVDAALASEWGRRGVQPLSARLGPDDPAAVDTADALLEREQNGESVDWPEKEPPPPAPPEPDAPAPPRKRKPRPQDEFRGMSIDDLGQFVSDAIGREDWEAVDRAAAEEERRNTANAAAREKRAAARDTKEAAQMAHYEQLLEAGTDDEDAIHAAFGISPEKQRRMNAITYLRGLGYQGNGLDELVRAWHADEAYQAWYAAEDELRGQLLAPRYREAGTVDPRKLWTMSETQALKYASDEMKAWWDSHGRVTPAELKAQLLDPADLADIMARRRDYLQ